MKMRGVVSSLNCGRFVLASLACFAGFVTGEPPVQHQSRPSGGYSDSVQSSGYGAPSGGYGNGGNSGDGYGSEPANYDFQYEVYGGGNSFGHQESRRDTKTNGKYHVLLPDGRRQIVTYIADETGYHPTITYEDEGSSGGYGSSGSSAPSGGYGSPDNSLSSPPTGGYSSRAKRQEFPADDSIGSLTNSGDLLKIYKSESISLPTQKYRNRRRRFTPKKTYLVVYPDLPTLRKNLKKNVHEK